MRRARLVAPALAVVALAAALATAATAREGARKPDPRCFGAADRDPQTPCRNPALRLKVTPTPRKALLTPNLACTSAEVDEVLEACAFGVPEEEAVETVAIAGDSHAAHWRAALAIVAQAKRWRVLEFATPHCPFSTSKPDSGPEMAKWCPEWNERLMRWIHEHPELRTVFLSSHTRAPIVVPTGTSAYAERERGFLEKWNQLPPSVQRLIVIRDNPIGTGRTFDCVRTAIRKRKPAGRRCADPRSRALAPDAQVSAAAQVQGREVDVIDLTPHFCGRDACLPVVGGVLVRKDVDHISQTFARTLGPYLLRGVDAALAG